MSVRRVSVLVIAAVWLASCSSSGPHKLTPSASSVTQYAIVTLASDVSLSGSAIVTCDGADLPAGLADPHTIAVLIPGTVAAGSAKLVVTVGADSFDPVALTITVPAALPSDPVTYVDAQIATIQQNLTALGSATTDPDVIAYIAVGQQNLSALQTQFAGLPGADQATVAYMIAADLANPSPQIFGITVDANFVRKCAAALAIGAVVAPTAPLAILTAAAILGVKYAPQIEDYAKQVYQDDVVAPINEFTVGLGNALQVPDGSGDFRPRDSAPVNFTSNLANDLPFNEMFRSVEPGDSTAANSIITETAQDEAQLPTLIAELNSVSPAAYPAPPDFSQGSSADLTLAAQFLSVDSGSVTNGVHLVSSGAGSDGLALTFSGPGTCVDFVFTVTYDDGINPKQTLVVPAQLDCESCAALASENILFTSVACTGTLTDTQSQTHDCSSYDETLSSICFDPIEDGSGQLNDSENCVFTCATTTSACGPGLTVTIPVDGSGSTECVITPEFQILQEQGIVGGECDCTMQASH